MILSMRTHSVMLWTQPRFAVSNEQRNVLLESRARMCVTLFAAPVYYYRIAEHLRTLLTYVQLARN